MPQISKVRIVNFYYNDGKRLIADELYDFSNKENDKALNVLINLANGGGKSVLVQLMMQPIIPKAKIAGRRIESFFNKSSDHCFVLLEWLKDNSTEKLLTGIAMATSESSNIEDENLRGRNIKYYTFYSNYTTYTSEYDIINMPLSKREKDRFVPADFDYVRTLSRKSNGALNYYASDDSLNWQKKLSEYGLIQNEWHMIEKLNSEEGGLSKYFGDFKTSDQLIDRLLIPTIESKLNQEHSKEDNSLSTMLISYAKQYASKKEVIHKKEVYENFEKELKSILPRAESLWTAKDNLNIKIKELFTLSDLLNIKYNSCKEEQKKYLEEIELLEAKAKKIQHEKASSEYYSAKEEYDLADKKYNEINETKKSNENQLKNKKHLLDIQYCSNYYHKIKKLEGNIEALQIKITNQENNSENASELAQLKYSIYYTVSNLLSEALNKKENLDEEKQKYEKQKKDFENKFENSKNDLEKAKEEYNRADERLQVFENETDDEIKKYNLEISRRLDGQYSNEELLNIQSNKEKNKDEIDASLSNTKEQLQRTIEEISSIPNLIADNKMELYKVSKNLDNYKEELENYYEKETQIKSICSEHTLDFDLRFTNSILDSLVSIQRNNQGKIAENIRKISIAQEEIQSAKRGSLHIPYSVIRYLNSTGVTYTTCEKYLTAQVENGVLSNDQCLNILKNYPAAAFGIIMTQKEKDKFFEFGREDWLPAMIPLYTQEQMDQILNNSKKFDGAIAFYSKEYFSNTKLFIETLENNNKTLINEGDILNSESEKLKKQIDIINSFNYSDKFESEQKNLIIELEQKITEINNKNKNLEDRKTELTTTQKNLEEKINSLSISIKTIETIIEGISIIINRITTEKALLKTLNNKKSSKEETYLNFNNIKSQLDIIIDNLSITINNLSNVEKNIEELYKVKNEIGNCEQTDIIDDDWNKLYEKYSLLNSQNKTELSLLKEKLNDAIERKKEYENEINRKEIPIDEYKDIIYSEDDYNVLYKEINLLESKLNDLLQKTTNALAEKAKASGKLDSKKTVLDEFGEPLPKSEVGNDFNSRLSKIKEGKENLYRQKEKSSKMESKINNTITRINDLIFNLTCPETIVKIELEDSFDEQFERIKKDYISNNNYFKTIRDQVNETFRELKRSYSGNTYGLSDAINGLLSLLNDERKGDIYFTIVEHIKVNISNTNRAIVQIKTDLNEFENNHTDLIRQCVLQGTQIYEGLKQMSSSSRVTVYDSKDKKQMLRFDIPDNVDSSISTESITDEIDKGTKEIVNKMSDESITDVEIKKVADKIVGSKNLLRKYIGKETIQVDAYKIDQNPQNAGYRSWEKTQINNSGAEKFIIYFAVILSLMNYTRGDFGSIRDKDLRSVLILDNPFGATSSKHILVPMFTIAKHFKVQMICLSDINKTDVINCFDIVIKAVVKKILMSNNEQLTHEGNESIEHGFYRSVQLSLL